MIARALLCIFLSGEEAVLAVSEGLSMCLTQREAASFFVFLQGDSLITNSTLLIISVRKNKTFVKTGI